VKNFALEKGRSLDLLRERRYIGKKGSSARSPRKPLVAPKSRRSRRKSNVAGLRFVLSRKNQSDVPRRPLFGRARRGSLRSVL
jgi:hypothetical protein